MNCLQILALGFSFIQILNRRRDDSGQITVNIDIMNSRQTARNSYCAVKNASAPVHSENVNRRSAHTLLNGRIGRSHTSIFCEGLYGQTCTPGSRQTGQEGAAILNDLHRNAPFMKGRLQPESSEFRLRRTIP